MDRRLLEKYNEELQHVREMGAEFAHDFPKIAGRLGLEGFEVADPYVERLFEGFAFLAARVQLRIDSEFPRFTEHLLQAVYPDYLAPIPSMAIVQFEPDRGDASLAAGVAVPRGSVLRSAIAKGEQTACEFRTAHDVTLWPIEIAEAEYFRFSGAAAALGIPALGEAEYGRLAAAAAAPGVPDLRPERRRVEAGLRLRLRTTGGLRLNQLSLDRIVLHLRGAEELPMQLYEQLLTNSVALVARPTRLPAAWMEVRDRSCIRRVGFDDDQTLLPASPRNFVGHRLLAEYFALPTRFLSVELSGLREAVRRCPDGEMDLIVLLNRSEPTLENAVKAANLALHCSPAINLFARRTDRINLSDQAHEHHVVVDRNRPSDFEVFAVTGAEGYATGGQRAREFHPFYAAYDTNPPDDRGAYFSVRRMPRARGADSDGNETRSDYRGSETFLMLVDANEAPFGHDLSEVAVSALCTNGDLPVRMPVGSDRSDFSLGAGAPVRSVRCLGKPTRPRAAIAEEGTAWRLISHLSLNYFSLIDHDDKLGGAALREILSLYADPADVVARRQIDGVKAVRARPVFRRMDDGGPIGFGRGLEVEVTFDEAAFRGRGVFLLGAVLDELFARYVSINSFTETVIRTTDRGEIARWPARVGQRAIL